MSLHWIYIYYEKTASVKDKETCQLSSTLSWPMTTFKSVQHLFYGNNKVV